MGLGADPTYHNLSEALNDFWERRIVPDRNSDASTLNRQWLPLFSLDARYNPNILALEEIRTALREAGRDKTAFYTELQSVPANRIETTILSKAQTLSPTEKEAFDTVLAKQKLFLNRGIK